MIRTIVIDDEEASLELAKNLLDLYCKNVTVLATADSVRSGYDCILEYKPDLVLLDVQMRDGSGFDLLRRFSSINFKIIFLTAYQEFAIEAFKFSALDYIQKPVSPAYLISAIKKAEESISNDELNLKLKTLLNNIADAPKNRNKIILRTQERIYSVGISDISRLEADGNYTTVYMKDGMKIMVSKLLKEFEELISDYNFIRVHQSHLVNMDFLFYYEKSNSSLILKDNTAIPVSSRKKEQVLQVINAM